MPVLPSSSAAPPSRPPAGPSLPLSPPSAPARPSPPTIILLPPWFPHPCPPSSFVSALSTRPLSVASPSSSSRPLLPSFLRPLFLLRLGWLPPLSLPPASSLPSPLVPLASPPYFVFPPSLLGSFPLKFCVASSLCPLAFPASAAASRSTPPFTAPPLLVCRSAAAEE